MNLKLNNHQMNGNITFPFRKFVFQNKINVKKNHISHS